MIRARTVASLGLLCATHVGGCTVQRPPPDQTSGPITADNPGSAVERLERASPSFDLIPVTVREATSPVFRLSPDGRRLALVILGQVWLADVATGHAEALADPATDPMQATALAWTPDASRLAVSLWGQPTDVAIRIYDIEAGGFEVWRPPAFADVIGWTPDGDTLLVLPREGRDTTLLRLSGRGEAERGSPLPRGVHGVGISPDGRSLVIAGPDGSGRTGLWLLDRATGARRFLHDDPAAANPSFDPSGERIVFRSGHGTGGSIAILSVSVGRVERVASGADRWIEADRPGWSPAGDAVLFAANGRFHRATLQAPEEVETIPFAAVHRVRRWTNLRRPLVPEPGDTVAVRGISEPDLSPTGDRIAFSAIGDLWLADTSGGEVRRLTRTTAHESAPTWSSDGRRLAFRRIAPGRDPELWLLSLDDGKSRMLPVAGADWPRAAVPNVPRAAWSPDGRRIAYLTGSGVGWVDLDTDMTVAVPLDTLPGSSYSLPGWTPDGDSLIFAKRSFDPDAPGAARYRHEVWVVAADGSGIRRSGAPPHATLNGAWSPDGSRAAFRHNGNAYIVELPPGGDRVAVPEATARDFSWNRDGSLVAYVAGSRLHLYDPGTGTSRALSIELTYTAPPAPPPLLITNVRVLDGSGRATSGPRDVLLAGGRIQRIAEPGTIPRPPTSNILDGDDRVLMPGLINTHVHLPPFNGIPPAGFLYYGTLTVRDLGSEAGWIQSQAERIEAGLGPGPRIVHSGGHLGRDVDAGFGNWRFVDPARPETLRDAIRDLDATGATFVKQWLRDPMLNAAVPRVAHGLGLPVTSHYPYASSFVQGLRGKEHIHEYYRPPDDPWHEDIMNLARAAGTCFTPTLLGEPVYRLAGRSTLLPVSRDALAPVLPLLPPAAIRANIEGIFDREMSPAEVAREDSLLHLYLGNVRRLHEAGVLVATGTDTGLFDRRTDLEIRLFAAAGLSPLEAIRAATLAAARCIGLEHEIGSVEPGKRADLLLVRRDPAEDLSALEEIEFVIVGGAVYPRAQLLNPGRE